MEKIRVSKTGLSSIFRDLEINLDGEKKLNKIF